MEWNGMEWNGMDRRNGMEWNGMEWNGMEWTWNGMRIFCDLGLADHGFAAVISE